MTSEAPGAGPETTTTEEQDLRGSRSPHLSPEQIASLDGAVVLDPEDLDEAIIGVHEGAQGVVAVYSYERLVDITARTMTSTSYQTAEAAAMEWHDYNTLRAVPYMGERAPVFVTDDEETGVDPEDVQDDEEDPPQYLTFGEKKYRVIS